ncbi:tetratricopeptide repeat protein [Kitasatospora sp. NPDC001664]
MAAGDGGGPGTDGVRSLADLLAALDGLRIRAARGTGKARVSLRDLEQATGIARSSLSGYLSGARPMPVDVLDAVVLALGVAPRDSARWAAAWERVNLPPAPAPLPAPPPAGAPAPRELPRSTPSFVGREAELAAIARRLAPAPADPADPAGPAGLADGPAVVVVHGPGGAGKSALVVKAAHAAAAAFPDGQLYADLRGASPGIDPLTVAEVLGRFLRSLGVPAADLPGGTAEAAARWRTLLAGRRVLLVLDNVGTADQVEALLPADGGCAALVTSRARLGLLDAVRIPLGGCPPDEALELLARTVGPGPVTADPGAAARVVEHCGLLPLAIRIAGARLAARPDWTPALLADRLADQRRRLDELRYGDLAVRSSLQVGLDALAEEQDRTALLLAAEAGLPRLTVPAVAALLGVAEPEADAAVTRLVEAGLLEVADAGGPELHDLVRLHAAEQAAALPAALVEGALLRLAGHYLGGADAAAQLLRADPATRLAEDWLDPGWTGRAAFADVPAAAAWLAAELPTLLALARRLAAAPGPVARYPLVLLRTLQAYLPRGGHWSDYGALAELALDIATRIADPRAEALALIALNGIDQRAGRFADAAAKLDRALPAARTAAGAVGEASVLSHYGHLHQQAGEHRRALERYHQVLDRYQELGMRMQQGLTLHNIGEIHLDDGDPARAVARLEECLVLQRDAEDLLGEALTLTLLGLAHGELGSLPVALGHLDTGLALAERTGHRDARWLALTVRAELRTRTGHPRQGADDARAARDLHAPSGDRYRHALALTALARANTAAGEGSPEESERARALLAGCARRPLRALERLLSGSGTGNRC